MYCTECGAQLTGGRFCGGCGVPVAQTPPGAPTVASPQAPMAQASMAQPAMAQPTDARASTMAPVRALPVGAYPWDYARDLGAAAVLIWSLGLLWSYSTPASSVV